jgi:hypothetical protein
MDKSTLESGGLRVECPHIDTDSLSKVGGSEEDVKKAASDGIERPAR